VNHRFAAGVAKGYGQGDYIWIHDYHLMLVAKYLRDMGVDERMGFFLHTPFPPPDIFMKLPWRRQVLEGLMAYDLVGFQTSRDRNNFLSCVGSFMKVPRSDTRRRVVVLKANNREIRVGSFGIGIDYEDFRKLARAPSVLHRAEEMRVEIPSSKIILGVDRLDYSKGIPERLLAFERALGKFPELIGEVTLVQITVPSRIAVPAYERLREEIEGLVGRINGIYTQQGWVPIHYIYRGFDRQNLVAFYRSADVALVTPLQDGMNLVANEYCATNIDNNGVLVLSEFAGAARRLGRNAVMVNPHDIDGMAGAIFQACKMPRQERHARMSRLRRAVRRRNVFWWLDTYLTAALVDDIHTVPDMSGIDLLGIELASLRR
jgi:trehalose 6-phosphate synthase